MFKKKRKLNRPKKPIEVVAKKVTISIFFGVMVLGLCFTMIYPIIKLFPNVFCDLTDLGNPEVVWIPINRSTLSFSAAWRLTIGSGVKKLLLSLGYAAAITLVQIFMCAMTGYAVARVKFPGSKLIFFSVLFVFLVPRQALFISQYLHFNHFDVFGLIKLFTGHDIKLIDQPFTLFLLALFGFGVNQSLFIFIFRQFFKNTPKELEEAALIDGCGFNRTYFSIMIPNAKPAIVTVGVLGFVWNYADTYYTGYFNSSGPYLAHILKTTLGSQNRDFVLRAIQTWYKLPLATTFSFDAIKQAGILIYMIPLLIFYFITQHWLVENVENAGIVG